MPFGTISKVCVGIERKQEAFGPGLAPNYNWPFVS